MARRDADGHLENSVAFAERTSTAEGQATSFSADGPPDIRETELFGQRLGVTFGLTARQNGK
jgi:hypothetical protein